MIITSKTLNVNNPNDSEARESERETLLKLYTLSKLRVFEWSTHLRMRSLSISEAQCFVFYQWVRATIDYFKIELIKQQKLFSRTYCVALSYTYAEML